MLALGCKAPSKTSGDKADMVAPKMVLELGATPDNPRNSEDDFVTLTDGKILFIYTHFTDSGAGNSDFGNAYLASRYSSDGGKTWSKITTVSSN